MLNQNEIDQILNSYSGDYNLLTYVIDILENSRTKKEALRRIIGLRQTRVNVLDVINAEKEK